MSKSKNDNLLSYLENKKIAMIYPSRYLIDSNLGKNIDSYEVVCRVGESKNINEELSKDYGNRCDIIIGGGSRFWFNLILENSEINDKNIKFILSFSKSPEFEIEFNKKYHSTVLIQISELDAFINFDKFAEEVPKFCSTGISWLVYFVKFIKYKELFITGMDFYNFGNYKVNEMYYSSYPDPELMPNGGEKKLGHPQHESIVLFVELLKKKKIVTDSNLINKLINNKYL